jgi:isoleucyl-tRNA synthetase
LVVRTRDEAERGAVSRLALQVAEELNVKTVRFATEHEVLVTYRVKPNFRTLGPRFGSKVNAVARAMQRLDSAAVEANQRRGEAMVVVIDGETIEVPADAYDVEAFDADGFAVVEENGTLVALDVTLTRELVLEGLAREFTHRVNGMRKDAGFNLEDRIALRYDADGDGAEVFERFGSSLAAEVLATSVAAGSSSLGDGAYRQVIKVDGCEVAVAIERQSTIRA